MSQQRLQKALLLKIVRMICFLFKDAVVNASLKDGAVLTGQKADKKYTDDNGEITYAALIDGNAETLDAYGLTINAATGDISVDRSCAARAENDRKQWRAFHCGDGRKGMRNQERT